jgi:hypothetical protein
MEASTHPHPPASNLLNTLSGSHLKTYNAIFQHPVSHNLEWRQVHALFGHIAEAIEQPNGNLRVTRNGQSLVLHPAHTKDVAEIEELMEIRRFLQRSEPAVLVGEEAAAHWLVVIDHHEARIFRSEMQGTVPQRILLHEPTAFFRHAPHSKEFARGQEKPNPNAFFQPVVEALAGPGKILVFGTGTGTSSEMEQFIAWVGHHHPKMRARIVGSVVIDEKHLTEAQLLAKAREHYATAAAS